MDLNSVILGNIKRNCSGKGRLCNSVTSITSKPHETNSKTVQNHTLFQQIQQRSRDTTDNPEKVRSGHVVILGLLSWHLSQIKHVLLNSQNFCTPTLRNTCQIKTKLKKKAEEKPQLQFPSAPTQENLSNARLRIIWFRRNCICHCP